MVKLKPIGSRLIVKPDETEMRTASGIYIPETTREKPNYGTVQDITADLVEDYGINIGDRVVFGKYAGTELELNEEKLLILTIDDVFGTLETVSE